MKYKKMLYILSVRRIIIYVIYKQRRSTIYEQYKIALLVRPSTCEFPFLRLKSCNLNKSLIEFMLYIMKKKIGNNIPLQRFLN